MGGTFSSSTAFFRPSADPFAADGRDLEARVNLETLRRKIQAVINNAEEREVRNTLRSFVDKRNYVCGRDREQEMLVNYLVSHARSNLSVIAIVGPAHVGKTTLAQIVYDDPRIADHFDCKSWVSVGNGDFDLIRTSRDILRSLTAEPFHDEPLDRIQTILYQRLTGKRFLIVLDDFCEVQIDDWDSFLTAFRFGSEGSVILLTTQDENVAQMAQRAAGPPPFYVEGLPGNDCWSIFKYWAYHRGKEEDTADGPDMVAIREKVIERCGGIPLVAKLLGNASYGRPAIVKLRVVKRFGEEGSLRELVHAYDRLPAYLKRCLSYCSLFPKGYLFNKDQLVRLWMAQDLLPPTERKRLEDVGISYFEEMLSRSCLLQSETDQRLYFIPSLMCDLIYSTSRNLHERVVDITRLPSDALHLSLVCESLTQCESFYRYNGLRSFLVMPTFPYTSVMHLEIQDEMFLKLECLRSLDLSYTDIEALPDTVGELKHLRFLALNHTKIKRLPDPICMLYHLQTLELKQCPWLKELPRGIGSLTSLRHLDVDFRHLLVHVPFQIQKLTNLQELPIFNICKENEFCGIGELQYLENLTELGIYGLCNVTNINDARKANMPNKEYLKILKLIWSSNDSVQDYEEFVVTDDYQNFLISEGKTGEEHEQNVHCCRNAQGSIYEQCSDHVELSSCDVDDMAERVIRIPDEQDSNFSSIQLRHGIINMGIQDSVSRDAAVSEEELLESLQPSIMLEILYIKSYGDARFPDWIGDSSFSMLVHVELVGCKCLVLPPLGQLQNLRFLRIDRMPVELAGIEFCGTGDANAFPQLEFLSFHNMNKWKKWDRVKEGDFPNLEKLSLFNCPQLRMVPNHFSSLEVLEVERCMELTDIPTSSLLQVLKLLCCDGLTVLPSLTSLCSLTIMYCQKLKSLPPLPQLKNIWIEDCEQLRSIAHCSCCPSSAELSCGISLESLLVAHCHQFSLPLAGLKEQVQSSNTGCCVVLSKFDETH